MKNFALKFCKKVCLLMTFWVVLSVENSFAQSTVMEISWTDVEYVNYKGLLVLYPNNQGFIKTKFYHAQIGDIWVYQNAVFSYQYDFMGNMTSYINCSYPQTQPNVPYSADNFVIFPNGRMYTQDYSGKWSTLVTAIAIQPAYWSAKFREYKIQ